MGVAVGAGAGAAVLTGMGRRGRRGRWTRAHQSADLTARDSRAGNADEGDDQYADRPSERRPRATR